MNDDQRSLSKTVATRDEVSIHITQSLARQKTMRPDEEVRRVARCHLTKTSCPLTNLLRVDVQPLDSDASLKSDRSDKVSDAYQITEKTMMTRRFTKINNFLISVLF